MTLLDQFHSLLDQQDAIQSIDSVLWIQLAEAAKDPSHPWNEGCFASVDAANPSSPIPQVRTVILRNANATSRTIDFFTDCRSKKIEELASVGVHAAASWLFYDSTSKIQLRIVGRTEVIDGPEADEAWNATPLFRRAAYLSLATPGTISDAGDPPDTSDRHVSQAESERGRENFRIVRTAVEEIDWLYLRDEGHVRARFEYAPDGTFLCRWIVP